MADYSLPTVTTLYAQVLTLLRDLIASVAKMHDGTVDTNIPAGAKKYDSTTDKFQTWNGSAWVTLDFHTPIDAHIADTSIHGSSEVGDYCVSARSSKVGWLLCDGTSKSTTTYAALFAQIGYAYGGSGGNFNVPNFQKKFPVGSCGLAGFGLGSASIGGSWDHAHASAVHSHTIPNHEHTLNDHKHTVYGHSHGLASHTHMILGHNHPTFNLSASGGSHSHSLDALANGAHGAYAAALKGNSATIGGELYTDNTPSHSHTISGTIGNQNAAALNGDNTMTSESGGAGSTQSNSSALTSAATGYTSTIVGLYANSTTPGDTGANNPPYVGVNVFIKY